MVTFIYNEVTKEEFITKLEELILDIKNDKAKFGKIQYTIRYDDDLYEPIFESDELFFDEK